MGIDLGTIYASVGLKTTGLKAGAAEAKGIMSGLDASMSTAATGGIKKAENSLSSFGKQLSAMPGPAGKAGSAIATVGTSLGTLGVAAVAAAAIGGLAFALFDCAKAASEEQKILAQTNAVIASTGGVANVTAGHVDELGNSLAQQTGIGHDLIKSMENIMLTFRLVANQSGRNNNIFDQSITATMDLSQALGKNLNDSAIKVGKALNDPVKGLTALRRYGVMFTDQQVEMVKGLVASNDLLGAQKVILAELNAEFGGSAKAFGATFEGQIGKIKDQFDQLKESVGGVMIAPLTGALQQFNWVIKVIHPEVLAAGITGLLASMVAVVNPIMAAGMAWQFLKGKTEQAVKTFDGTKKGIAGIVEEISKVNAKDIVIHADAATKNVKELKSELEKATGKKVTIDTSGASSSVNDLDTQVAQLDQDLKDLLADSTGAGEKLKDELAMKGIAGVSKDSISSMVNELRDGSWAIQDAGFDMVDQLVKGISRGNPEMTASASALTDGLKMGLQAASLAGTPITGDLVTNIIQGIMKDGPPEMQKAGAELIAAMQGYFNANPIKPKISDADLKSIGKQVNVPVIFNPDTGKVTTAKEKAGLPVGTEVRLNPVTGKWEIARDAAGKPITSDVKFNPVTGEADAARNRLSQSFQTLLRFVTDTSQADAEKERLSHAFSSTLTITEVKLPGSGWYDVDPWIVHTRDKISKGLSGVTAKMNVGFGGAGTPSLMDELTKATALANASFGNFIGDMTSAPFKEVEEAIMRLTNQNSSSLGDWRNIRKAYDDSTASLAKYEKQIKAGETAIDALQKKIDEATAARNRPSLIMTEEENDLKLQIMQAEDAHSSELAAMGKEELALKLQIMKAEDARGGVLSTQKAMSRESNELDLKIMQAEDAHQYAQVNKLKIQKTALDRKKEEFDLTTQIADDTLQTQLDEVGRKKEELNLTQQIANDALQTQLNVLARKHEELDLVQLIADETKELKDTSAFAGKTTAEIDALIAKWNAALLKKTSQVAALKVTYEKVQTSVDKFKKIIDDLSSYFTSKSPPPSYQSGTSYVPATGLYGLHKGEAVIPANLNPVKTGVGRDIVINLNTDLDGKVIAQSTTRIQGQNASAYRRSGARY